MEVTISPILLAIIVALTLMFSGTIYILIKKNTYLEERNNRLLSIKNELVTQNNSKLSKINELSNELTVIKKDFRESTDKWLKEEKDFIKSENLLKAKLQESEEIKDNYYNVNINLEKSLKNSSNNYNSLHKRYELLELQKVKLNKDNSKLNREINILEDKCKEKDSLIDAEKIKVKSLAESCDSYIQDIKQIKKELASTKGSNTKLKTTIERLKKSSK